MFVLGNAISTLASFIGWAAQIYVFLLIGNVICSWVSADPYNPIVRFVRQLTDPLLDRIRGFIPPMGGFDFSALVAILVIQFGVQGFLVSTLHDFARQMR